ncbi:MAG: hypothetical protein J7K61_05610 [Thermoplasmata archaeon]|nr:hypothetical protein [Thermoplasmata archaeon]
MKLNIKKIMCTYGIIAGIAYAIAGVMEIMGMWYRDIFGGIALLIISSVYLSALGYMDKEKDKALAFVIVGAILSSIFGILYILILFANWLESLIGEAYNFNLRAEIVLFVAVLPLLYMIKREVLDKESQIFQ